MGSCFTERRPHQPQLSWQYLLFRPVYYRPETHHKTYQCLFVYTNLQLLLLLLILHSLSNTRFPDLTQYHCDSTDYPRNNGDDDLNDCLRTCPNSAERLYERIRKRSTIFGKDYRRSSGEIGNLGGKIERCQGAVGFQGGLSASALKEALTGWRGLRENQDVVVGLFCG